MQKSLTLKLLLFLEIASMFRALQVLSITNAISPIKSSVREISTPRGPRIITNYETNLEVDQRLVFDKLADFKSWGAWLSPESRFEGGNHPITKSRQTFTEVFGLFDSSSITWEVDDYKPHSTFAVISKSSVGTFGWDTLALRFDISPSIEGAVSLNFTYSWTVPNPTVAIVEKLLIRKMMMKDNEKALGKLCQLCLESMHLCQ